MLDNLPVSFPASGMLPATFTPFLTGADPQAKRHELADYFCHTFDLYTSLFDCIADPQGWFTKAIPLRHPLIFYFGHTAAFFINKLIGARLLSQRINARIESLVAIGVDEMSWDDLNDDHYAWPSIEELRLYRQQVRETVLHLIRTMPLTLPIDWESPAWVILMGIEHERIHLETSSVLIRQLPLIWTKPQSQWPICPFMRTQIESVPLNSLIPIQGQQITLGKRDATYGWDNEYGSNPVHVSDFLVSQQLVSNAEFLTFVQAGGYLKSQYWDDEGWRWRNFAQATMPSFWRGDIDNLNSLQLRLMTECIPMPWDWPVEVNQLEATAFCRWKTEQLSQPVRLPDEAEWYVLREKIDTDQPDWQQPIANINLACWASPCPVNLFLQHDLYDIVGNVWQWTCQPIDGYSGFKIHPLYDDFSTPTFDGNHMLMKGGSWISTGNEALRSARYAFRRHFFQHAGFRYVIAKAPSFLPTMIYETDFSVAQSLAFDYGTTPVNLPCYASALLQCITHHITENKRLLILGCGTGRVAFEAARQFICVDAADRSARFIDVALRLVEQSCIRYQLPAQGELVTYCEARLSDHEISTEIASRINFIQADVENIKPYLTGYSLIVVNQEIEHLADPVAALIRLSEHLNDDGMLVICSSYDWNKAITPREIQPGGKRERRWSLCSPFAGIPTTGALGFLCFFLRRGLDGVSSVLI